MLQPRHVVGDAVTVMKISVARRGLSCIGTVRNIRGGQDPTQLNLQLTNLRIGDFLPLNSK